ncbi:MAG: asparagine synthase [Bacteroidota bacterium]|jgi:asparagine synthase (glutamine-hydrolysing)
MCGIAGAVSKNGFRQEVLNLMSGVIRHRGPDDEGFLTVNDHGDVAHLRGKDTISELSHLPHISDQGNEKFCTIGLVHRRLSILDLSKHGHQPMTDLGQKFHIVFNGEIYNYRELRDELKLKGYHFTTESDTEVILAAYQEYGLSCASKLMGMWAFAIYDTTANLLFISRDRFGIKPLYLYMQDEELVFASEIKSILAYPSVKAKLNEANTYQYLSFGKLEDPYATLFENIIELPVGYNLVYALNEDRITIKSYYKLEEAIEQRRLRSKEHPYKKYEKYFQQSIDMHLRSDVPVGSCLSGGLDSSAIVAFAAIQLRDTPFNTFTAIYDEENIDESKYAKMVSDHFPNIKPYYTKPNAQTYWNDLDKLIWHQDLPIASTSMFAQWEVMKLASNHGMKVLLDGQGADESIGGYSIFTGVYLFSLLKRLQFRTFMQESKAIKANRSVNIKNEVGRAAFNLLPESIKTSVRSKQRIGKGFINDDFLSTFSNIKDKSTVGNNYLHMSTQAMKYGMHELLRYEDRNSMAFSIESRVPFLDHRLVEFTLALPEKYKLREGWTKYALRKIVDKRLPKEVTWRKDKKGFVTPQYKWKKELQQELITFINEAPMPAMINKKFMQQMVTTDLTNASQLSEFWKMVSFAKWLNIYNLNK